MSDKVAAAYNGSAELIPGSPEWLKFITASKVPVILGLSEFSSPKILWHQMTGTLPAEEQNDDMRRGHFLEPAILAWFYSRHRGALAEQPTHTMFNPLIPWGAASPDSLALDLGDGTILPVEAKSERELYQWGTPGTDQIPRDHAAQCLWTLHIMQAKSIFVPMIGPFLDFAEYQVDYNPTKAAQMEAVLLDFYQSLSTGVPPALSDHPKEYEVLRKLHPSIDLDATVQVDADLAFRFISAKHNEKAASDEWTAVRAAMNEAMGEAATAYYGQTQIAARQAKGSGVPYVAAPRKLPALEAITS